MVSFLIPSRHIATQIEIEASPAHVWRALTETSSFPNWNPLFCELTGSLKIDQTLTVRLRGNGKRRGMVFYPKVLTVVPERRLVWVGKLLGLPGLFTGTHKFELIPTDTGTMFRQSEAFFGIMLWFFDVETVRSGFIEMNEALKTRAESLQ